MSPPQQLRQQTSNCSSLLIYRPRKAERLSWLSWLTYSGWLTHISGHPSATSRAQDSDSTSAKDQCYTAGPRQYRIQFKTAAFMHRVTTQRCTSYVADLVAFCSSDSRRRPLRSTSTRAPIANPPNTAQLGGTPLPFP